MKRIYIIALIVALLTGAAVYLFAQHLEQKATVVVPMGSVVVALAPIDENVKITSDMVGLSSTAKEWILPGAATRLEDVVGKMNKYRIPAGQQIISAQLASDQDIKGGRLSYVLEKGMRAITISTDEIAGVGFYINKNDRVDILSTSTAEKKNADGEVIATTPVTELLLENVKVLEVASRAQNEAAAQTPVYSYGSITLSLSPEDCVKLYHALVNARLQLVLRASEDNGKAAVPEYIHPAYEWEE